MTRDEIKAALQSDVYTITFLKANGDTRVMNCTLLEEYIPAPQLITEEGSEGEKKRIGNDNVLPVWDIDENGWRSFRIDSIQSMFKAY